MDIRLASTNDAPMLATFARETFVDTFLRALGHSYPEEDLAAFLAENYTPEFFVRAIGQGDWVWIARRGDEMVGYAKAGRAGLPVKNPIEPRSEIHRLYVVKEHKGQGIGKRLMQAMLEAPVLRQSAAIYLGVWENNHPAQQFYGRYGFKTVGEYSYYVGSHADRELIMCRKQ